MAKIIPMSEWGHDHWSTLAYIETCAVEHQALDDQKMRADGKAYPTRLRGFSADPRRAVAGHSDWDCVLDMIAAGLLKAAPGTNPHRRHPLNNDLAGRMAMRAAPASQRKIDRYILTPAGRTIANALREHKAAGGNFANFVPPVVS
jgi:hypothetical protein